jgi:hypothetical protein
LSEEFRQAISATSSAFANLEADKRIVVGGIPVGYWDFAIIIEAESSVDVDEMLQDLPTWGFLSWNVIPLNPAWGILTRKDMLADNFDGRHEILTMTTTKYLVTGAEIEDSTQTDDILDKAIPLTINTLAKFAEERKIIAGGVLVPYKTLVFIIDAASREDVDELLRSLLAWDILNWEVSPLKSFG